MSTQINEMMITKFHDQLTNVQTPAPNEVRELIARRAYELYENRGHDFGNEISDWLQAEDEIVTMLLSLPIDVAQVEAPDDPRPPRARARTRKTIKTTGKKSINQTTNGGTK
ncbi:MAG TPA: DUF2934 domain-containing protein [Blastocatellia bacterium]|nr:DUF2934 domain-containing protein [Blastocatellia bacterium]